MENDFIQMLEELYQKKYTDIYQKAYEMLGDVYAAEDVAEEVFIAVISHQVWWAKQNERVRFEYVMQTCEKLCRKLLDNREQVRLIEYEEKISEGEGDGMETVVQGLEVKGYLENLSELDRKIFEERYYNNRTIKEIACLNNMSENNVSKHLSRGREKMFENIKKENKKGAKP